MYTIGELSGITKLSRRTLRYYEERGLIFSHRTDNGTYRLYSDITHNKIMEIMKYKKMGFRLDEIQKIIQMKNTISHIDFRNKLIGKLEEKENEFKKILEEKKEIEKNISAINKFILEKQVNGLERELIMEIIFSEIENNLQKTNLILGKEYKTLFEKEKQFYNNTEKISEKSTM